MNLSEFRLLLQKFVAGHCTPDEEMWLLEWYDKIPPVERESLSPEERNLVEKRIWEKLEQESIYKPHGIASRSKRFLPPLKVAASIIFLISIGTWLYLENSDQVKQFWNGDRPSAKVLVTNPGSSTIHVELEDGTRISLEPGSELNYPKHFSSQNREVRLSGEAFFEVAHDAKHPFIVYAHEIVTKVLGTSFTIKAYEDRNDVSVIVRTGRVSVTTNEKSTPQHPLNKEVFLTPNQQIVVNRNSHETSQRLVDKPQIVEVVPSLKMNYTNSPVVDVFEAIEKAYGVDIKFDKEKMAACRITTELTEEDLYQRVQVICLALGATYTVDQMSIVIESKGCN